MKKLFFLFLNLAIKATLIQQIKSFDASEFGCAPNENLILTDGLLFNQCTIYSSMHFSDYSSLNLIASINATSYNECCNICNSYGCDYFLIQQLIENQVDCNFYSNSVTSIDLCVNDYLSIGIPAFF